MITSFQDVMKLNNGAEMQVIGLGCYRSKGDEGYRAIRFAAENGYRHFDTAAYYENEREVGNAIRDCGVPREKLFVVTKLWPLDFLHAREALDKSLSALNIGYVDAYLLHWPGVDVSARYHAWEMILDAITRGDVRGAGVSNFCEPHLTDLTAKFGVTPVLNQLELHPWHQQRSLCAACKKQGIAVTAWGPLFHGHLAEEPLMQQLGEIYARTPAQITLRWALERGFCIIPKSVTPERILANTQLFDFALTPADLEKIDALDGGRSFSFDPFTFDGNR